MAFTGRIGKGGRGRCRSDISPVQEGRQPRVQWTPARQEIYLQMKADYDANPSAPTTLGGKIYKTVLGFADAVPYAPANTNFLWPTFIYQVTGDTSYATKAYGLIESTHINPYTPTYFNDGNIIRESILELIMALDWLWPALTPTQQDALIDHIDAMFRGQGGIGGNAFTSAGFNTRDSDQVVALYFAVVIMYHLFPTDQRFIDWYNLTETSAIPSIVGTGGTVATGSNRITTARNAVKFYVETMAAGGEWIESSDYNHGTPPLVFQGYDGITTVMGQDDFPEIAAYLPLHAKRQISLWTPDLLSEFKWGDNEHSTIVQIQEAHWHWTLANYHLAGLLQGTTEGEQMMDLIIDLNDRWQYGTGALSVNGNATGMGPSIRFGGIAAFNPYAPRGDRTEVGKSFYAGGQGVMIQRTGWDTDDSMCIFHGCRDNTDNMVLDHASISFGDFMLWKDGEWLIDRINVYSDAPHLGWMYNSPLSCGLPAASEYVEVEHHVQTDNYAHMTVTQGGSHAGFPPYFNPPSVFCHEWTRHLLYFPGINDIIVVFDRAHVVDPGVLTRYPAALQTTITNAPSRKQFLFHTMVEPTFASGAYTWNTPDKSTPMKWTPLLPATQTRTVYNMDDDNSPVINWGPPPPPYYTAIERAGVHQVRIWPTNVQNFDTFVNVFQAGLNPGAVTLIEDTGKVQGVHIVRGGGEADIVAFFNSEASAQINSTGYHASHAAALPLQRFRETGFTISWTASTNTTEVYGMDMNPANTWTKNIDGAGAVDMAEDAEGHVVFEVSGTGPHSIVAVGS